MTYVDPPCNPDSRCAKTRGHKGKVTSDKAQTVSTTAVKAFGTSLDEAQNMQVKRPGQLWLIRFSDAQDSPMGHGQLSVSQSVFSMISVS